MIENITEHQSREEMSKDDEKNKTKTQNGPLEQQVKSIGTAENSRVYVRLVQMEVGLNNIFQLITLFFF